MKLLIALALLFSLAACGEKVQSASAEPAVAPVVVDRIITKTCVPEKLGEPPEYADEDAKLKAAADAAERYQLLWAGHIQRVRRSGEVEPVITGCRK